MHVSSINSTNRLNYTNKFNNNTRQTYPMNSEISFNGKEKRLTASLAALATFVQASIFGMKKTKTEPETKVELTPMEAARQENSAFINALANKTHVIKDRMNDDKTVRDYSDATILVLHKYNKENPKFAYYLAKATQNGGDTIQLLTEDETEEIATAMKKNLEVVKTLQYPGYPKSTLKVIEIYKSAPNATLALRQFGFTPSGIKWLSKDYKKSPETIKDLAGMNFNEKEINALFYSYENYPNSVKSLADVKGNLSKHYFRAADIAKMSENYEMNKDAISTLLAKPEFTPNYGKYNGKFLAAIVDTYRENPDLVEKYLKIFQYLSEDEMNELVKLTLTTPKYVDMALNEEKDNFKKASSVVEFAAKSTLNEKYFEKLQEKNQNKPLSFEEMKMFNTIDADDKKFVDKILDDNRATTPKEIIELIPVYKKFDGQNITDEMIAIAKDPLAEVFGL